LRFEQRRVGKKAEEGGKEGEEFVTSKGGEGFRRRARE
jgi:hypothetical protein